jgi:diacylglycerol kinase family enzyme
LHEPNGLFSTVKSLLIINPSSGDGGAGELVRRAAQRGIETHVLVDGENPGVVARAAEADLLAMAGGDGSLGAVAGVAVERDLPFACVPFGTRNHFAHDLGLDVDDPLSVFDDPERRVDVGRVGERVFLNNVSLGIYARLVHERERHRRRRQALARLRAFAILATHREADRVTVDGEPIESRVVLVANNGYELSPLSLGRRERLDEGLLHLYAPCSVLRSSWEERSGDRFTIDAATSRLRAAIDGEPTVLETPIELTIEPQALRVLAPSSPRG